MEWFRWIFGYTLVLGGVGFAAHASLRLHQLCAPTVYPRLRTWWKGLGAGVAPDQNGGSEPATAPMVVQSEPKLSTPRRNPAPQAGLFEATQPWDRVMFDQVPLPQTGRDQHYDLVAWSKVLAWLIYSRFVPELSGRVGGTLEPTMFKFRVDDQRKLTRLLWIRLEANETVVRQVRGYYSLEHAELETQLKGHLLDTLEGFLTPEAFVYFGQNLHLQLFEKESKQGTTFTADFLPLFAALDAPIPCEAYLLTGSGSCHVNMPGLETARMRVNDQEFGIKQGYFPLVGGTAECLEVGPAPSCHLQTPAQVCEGKLVLGWRESQEVSVGGILEIRELKPGPGESFFLRFGGPNNACEEQLRPKTRARLTMAEEGRQTTFEIWRRKGESQNLLLTLVLQNRRPPLDSLPDCGIFEGLLSQIHNSESFIRFLASQIYFATKRQKNTAELVYLEDAAGIQFFNDDRHGGPLFNRGRKREPLRCRLKLCVSPGQLDRLHEWFGDRELSNRMSAELMALLREVPAYQEAFPGEVLPSLQGGAGTPGLSIEVGADSVLGTDTLLIRCLPVFLPNRRREIYGRLLFDAWPGARDRSEFSCQEGLTFFTDYPQGVVALHLSRFPVYEVQTPGLYGAIKINLNEPGSPGARVKIENHSSATLLIDGNPLHRPSAQVIDLAGRAERTIHLEVGERRASLILYPEPLAQLDEPLFVPEPARLDLYGLTLNRRLDRSGVDGARAFQHVWMRAQEVADLRLLGASQATQSGFFAILERRAVAEHHFLANRPTLLEAGKQIQLEAGESTLLHGPLGLSCKINESGPTPVQIDYQRFDFQRQRIVNAPVLAFDYYEYWINQLEPLVPPGQQVARVELARCVPGDWDARDNHLYIVETRSAEEVRMHWLWHKPAGIRSVRLRGSSQVLFGEGSASLVGPIEGASGKLFLVDWTGELETPVSFDVEDHEDQIRKYLADGFFSLREDAPYVVGGKLGEDVRSYKSAEPLYIAGQELRLQDDPDGQGAKTCLNFNPRDFASFFDKDSYRIRYSGKDQSFVLESQAHRKEAITPKTLFLIVPEGGYPILGSHALSPIAIPSGVNYLVLPGLTFKISQGPVYYA